MLSRGLTRLCELGFSFWYFDSVPARRLKLEIRGAANCVSHVFLVAPTCHGLPALKTFGDGSRRLAVGAIATSAASHLIRCRESAETQLARAWHAIDPPRIQRLRPKRAPRARDEGYAQPARSSPYT